MMDEQSIYEKIQTARLQRFMTNCYSMNLAGQCRQIWSHGDEFLFRYEDHGVQRLIYFVRTLDARDRLLAEIGGGRYFLEFMTKNPDEYRPEQGTLTAAMMRMTNSDCRSVFREDSPVMQYRDAAAVENAREQDAEEINRILWTTFRTEISHLLSADELSAKIRDGQITIHRNAEKQIDALLQAEAMPRKFYINQIVNKGSREIIHAILLNRLEQYVDAGGKYLYAWVEDKNIASVKFHEKYGMKHDGMWSMLFCMER